MQVHTTLREGTPTGTLLVGVGAPHEAGRPVPVDTRTGQRDTPAWPIGVETEPEQRRGRRWNSTSTLG